MTLDEDRLPRFSLASAPTSTVTSPVDPALKSDSILIAEFTYASSSAHEAVDDRARLFDRYLLIFGGVFVSGATAIYQLNQISAKNFIEPLAVVAFAFTGLLGVAFLRTFVRIRQAFVDALVAMSQIKEYYLHSLRTQEPSLSVAFKWRLDTVPETDKRFTVSYLMAHLVATLGSLSFGLGTFVTFESFLNGNNGNLLSLPHNPVPYVVGVGVLAATLATQLTYYRRACRGKTHEEKLEFLKTLEKAN